MMVTYEQKDVLYYNLHHRVRHEKGNQLLGKFFCISPFFTAKKGKINEEKSIRKIVSTCRKQTPITGVSLGLLQQNKDFHTPLE